VNLSVLLWGLRWQTRGGPVKNARKKKADPGKVGSNGAGGKFSGLWEKELSTSGEEWLVKPPKFTSSVGIR
jgi:hypothetical protein